MQCSENHPIWLLKKFYSIICIFKHPCMHHTKHSCNALDSLTHWTFSGMYFSDYTLIGRLLTYQKYNSLVAHTQLCFAWCVHMAVPSGIVHAYQVKHSTSITSAMTKTTNFFLLGIRWAAFPPFADSLRCQIAIEHDNLNVYFAIQIQWLKQWIDYDFIIVLLLLLPFTFHLV